MIRWYWHKGRLLHVEYGDLRLSDFYKEEDLKRLTTPIPEAFISVFDDEEGEDNMDMRLI